MSAVEETYRALRQMLVEGRFKPGERLKEPELVETLAVSRTPLREAFRVLEADGLLTLAGRGASVWDPSVEDVLDLYEYRASLEAFTAEQAARRNAAGELAPSQLARLEALRVEMDGAADDRSRATSNVRFHGYISELAGNRNAIRALDRVWAQISLASATNFREPAWRAEVGDQHREIVQAIEAGDAHAAADASRHHVREAAAVYSRIGN